MFIKNDVNMGKKELIALGFLLLIAIKMINFNEKSYYDKLDDESPKQVYSTYWSLQAISASTVSTAVVSPSAEDTFS